MVELQNKDAKHNQYDQRDYWFLYADTHEWQQKRGKKKKFVNKVENITREPSYSFTDLSWDLRLPIEIIRQQF